MQTSSMSSSLPVRLNVFKSVEDIAKQRGKVSCSVFAANAPFHSSNSHTEQVVLAGPTLADTLLTASESLGETVVALRSSVGALVTDVNVLR